MPSSFSHHPRTSSRNHFVEPPSFTDRFISSLPDNLVPFIDRPTNPSNPITTKPRSRIQLHIRRAQQRLPFKWLASLRNLLILVWILVLWWGERWVFRGSVRDCQWGKWEKWPLGSTPHHLIFIADPQLVDPHTYPGRPWPLSTLTIRHTDLYLTRSYSLMQTVLHPDTILFLGDLFDGGREWGTDNDKSHSPEERYKKYGQNFWLREYERFGRIFFDHWSDGGMEARKGQRGRKMIVSLPGNHDLGLGAGIQRPVRDRFGAYFGEGNRIDVVGNHTFVSVDTVSLSAMSQADPSTGSQGSGESGESNTELKKIWMPVEEFLNSAQSAKRRAVGREMRYLNGKIEELRHEHVVSQTRDTRLRLGSLDGGEGSREFPTILLTHVPLYRLPGTPCGPQREHWPPSAAQPIEKDERNGIAVRAGYQYQNVLTPEVSKLLVEKVGNIAHVFSGDDHDYCEVLHKGYTTGAAGGGGIREITVKSISWAMGVRKPGFVMLSLWNPVDEVGDTIMEQGEENKNERNATSTMQSHLCLLPDQLGVFITYVFLLAITVAALNVRAFLIVLHAGSGSYSTMTESAMDLDKAAPLLPTRYRGDEYDNVTWHEKLGASSTVKEDSQAQISSLATAPLDGLSARMNNKPRSGPHSSSPKSSSLAMDGFHPHTFRPDDFDDFQPANPSSVSSIEAGGFVKGRRKAGFVKRMARELARSLGRVGFVAGLWYAWLVWWG